MSEDDRVLLGLKLSKKNAEHQIDSRVPGIEEGKPGFDFGKIDHLSKADWVDAELSAMVRDQNDRGVAITYHAAVDDRLRWAIEQTFIGALSNTDKAELFEGTNPLATYSARCRLAYALGLITKGARGELQLLGQIRNRFAHEFRPQTFSSPNIAKLCQNLPKDHQHENPMVAYATLCFTLMTALFASGALVHQRKRDKGEEPNPPPTQT